MRTIHVRAALALGVVAVAGCTPSSQKDPSPAGEARSADTGSAAHLPKARLRTAAGLDTPPRRNTSSRRGPPYSGPSEVPAVTYLGGPVMTVPKVVPVLFPGNPYDAQLRDYLQKLPGSAYWHGATAEYGVGPLTVLPVYEPTDPPPDPSVIGNWIAALATSGTPGVPPPDANTIYAIMPPPNWACGGYHNFYPLPSGQNVVYTVDTTCSEPLLGLSGLDLVTAGLSHEIAESATDSLINAYWGANWAMSGWASAATAAPEGELADMCEFQPNAFYVDPGIGYMVSRVWSNQAAAGGHDPCRPLLSGEGPYFTADPILREGTRVQPGIYARGVTIAPGTSVTIPVVLRSDGPVGAWQLSAEEVANPHSSAPDIYDELSFSWDQASGSAGDTRYLTITRTPPPAGNPFVLLRVAINSTLGSVTHTNWLVLGVE